MNEVKMLSGKTINIEKSGEFKFGNEYISINYPDIPTQDFRIEDNGHDFSYHFYTVSTAEEKYAINSIDYERIIKSIEDGAKFVKIKDDVVNVNQIRMFKKINAKKKFTYYSSSGISDPVKLIVDQEGLDKFMKELKG